MNQLETYRQVLEHVQSVNIAGRVSGVRGLTVSVSEFPVPLGARCRIVRSGEALEAQVIGFAGEQTLIMPIGRLAGIRRGDRVVMTATQQTVAVGQEMLGRVLDGFGQPLDGRGAFAVETRAELWPQPLTPMDRPRIDQPLATGVRAIDSMLTIGRGQRMGVFSPSGVGKTVLLGMISRFTTADVAAIALIGERGREVRDFIERDLGPDGLRRSVVVVSTSDQPALVRVQAGAVATAIAEHFRDRGGNVLLVMDSLTRLATAQRQIGLAAGEPPAARGYTPSVFSLLPELMERAGRTNRGSITGFYSVLVEGDDAADPITDAVRSVTDGHIFLSRQLAGRGQYPAVDVLASVSRVMRDVVDGEHRQAAGDVHRLMSLHAEIEDLVSIGAYQSGASAAADLAVEMMPEIRRFLAQDIAERAEFAAAKASLLALREAIRRQSRRLDARAAGGQERTT